MNNSLTAVPRRSRSVMHAYQDRGAKWLIDHHDAGLFFDPGLGKSITTLTAIADLKARGELGGKVLIVGPPRVVTTVWAQEAAAWEHTAGLEVLVLSGTPEQRKQLLVERFRSADIVAVSYGLLSWLHKLVKRERWFWVVIDESSMVKDHRSKRWRNVAYTALAAKRRTILTGTPTPKSLADLWAQVTVADLGRRFGKSPTRFLNRYFIQDFDGHFVLRHDARKALTEQLRDFALALRAKDYLDLPALVETVVPVTMPPSAWAVYEELARSFEAELADGTQIDVANAGVMAGKLQQVAQGSIVVDASGAWQELHRAKLDAVEALVSELGGEPVLIAYWYKHDLARLKTLFPEAPVLGGSLSERKLNELIQRWNQGAIPVLLLHPQSAGHGLNLQAGGRHLIWMAVPWSWELYTQATARLYRQGQTKPVMVYRIIAEYTIDERILQVLADRQDGHDTLVAALKAEVRQTVDRVKAARAAMQKAHPDRGGSTEAFIAARKAYEQAKKEAA